MSSGCYTYTPRWDGNLNLDETLTFITLFVNGGSVCLIKASIVTRTFTSVLMVSIRASRSLNFWVVDLPWSLCIQSSRRVDLSCLLVSSPVVSWALLEDRDSDIPGLLPHLECKFIDWCWRLLVECSWPALWQFCESCCRSVRMTKLISIFWDGCSSRR